MGVPPMFRTHGSRDRGMPRQIPAPRLGRGKASLFGVFSRERMALRPCRDQRPSAAEAIHDASGQKHRAFAAFAPETARFRLVLAKNPALAPAR